jgi:hypothetical protein
MHRRYLSAVILLLALVTGATGKLVVSAFCPTFGSSECHEGLRDPDASHSAMTHEMHGMHMAGTSLATEQRKALEWQIADRLVQPIASSNAVESTVDPCSHCVSHSNPPRSAPALHQADLFRSFGHVAEAEVTATVPEVVLSPRIINPREHAPPGFSSPLHVRINVFRI